MWSGRLPASWENPSIPSIRSRRHSQKRQTQRRWPVPRRSRRGARVNQAGARGIEDQRLAAVISGDTKVDAVVGGHYVVAIQKFWILDFRFLINAVRCPWSVVRGASQLRTEN